VGIHSEIDLTGKLAVVTGAGRGIGAAIAGAFAEAGADVVVADLDDESAQQTAHRLTSLGRRALAVRTDVGVPLQVSELFNIVRTDSVGSISWSTTPEFGLGNHFWRSPILSGI
jgi:NAD(P)-dependent dehydrogenase (short-subunit alcohol dehydrogenase family)